MEAIRTFFQEYLRWLSLPTITIIDLLEIVLIAFLSYHIILWVKNTRAYSLVKGMLVLILLYVLSYVLDMTVVLWIFNRTIGIGITAVIIVFQPELRTALEQLGRKNILYHFISFDEQKEKYERFSDRTVNEIVRATYELAKTKTGALIIIEHDITLAEYERTGIKIDSAISSQLLINIFEHNTPLHDGAVIVRKDRIAAATCYLPLSDNMRLSKELGTRHRAGIGISEVTDSLTIIVSEETGLVSIAYEGEIVRNVDGDALKKKLSVVQGKSGVDLKKSLRSKFSRRTKSRQ